MRFFLTQTLEKEGWNESNFKILPCTISYNFSILTCLKGNTFISIIYKFWALFLFKFLNFLQCIGVYWTIGIILKVLIDIIIFISIIIVVTISITKRIYRFYLSCCGGWNRFFCQVIRRILVQGSTNFRTIFQLKSES